MYANSDTYDRIIQLRICTAITFGVSGIGLVVFVNLRLSIGAACCGIIALVSLGVVLVLIAEQLFAAWMATKRGRISLAALLLMTGAFGVFFTVMRNSVTLSVTLLVLTLALVSAALESKRKPKHTGYDAR